MLRRMSKLALADESVDLAFDTEALRKYGEQYGTKANDLREMAKELDDCLNELKTNGWTTNAGEAFNKMVKVNWKDNIEKYASMLDTLNSIMTAAASDYEILVEEIENTKL